MDTTKHYSYAHLWVVDVMPPVDNNVIGLGCRCLHVVGNVDRRTRSLVVWSAGELRVVALGGEGRGGEGRGGEGRGGEGRGGEGREGREGRGGEGRGEGGGRGGERKSNT